MPTRHARRLRGALPLSAVVLAVALSGCAPWLQRTIGARPGPSHDAGRRVFTERFEPPVPCGAAPYPSLDPDRTGHETLRIGSLRFRGLAYPYGPDRFRRGAPALMVPFEIPALSRAYIEVAPDKLAVAGLDPSPMPTTQPARAHRAVRCLTGSHSEVASVSFVIDGPRCVPVSVTVNGETATRDVAFGVRRCP